MKGTLNQIFALGVLGQVLIATGLNYGLNSITLIQVPAEPDRFLDDQQLIWTIVVTTIGALLGCLLAAPLAPILGTKRLVFPAFPLGALGSLACSFGNHFWWMLAGRILMQVSLGMTEATVRAYVCEIAPTHRRSIYSTICNAMVYGGQVLVLALGPLLNWRVLFLITGCAPAAICMIGVLFLPSSPTWLLSRGRPEEEAAKSLRFFRNADSEVSSDVKKIAKSLREIETVCEEETTPTWRLMLQRETRLPLLLASVQITLFVWCGGGTLTQIGAYVFAPLQLPVSGYYTAMLPPLVSMLTVIPASPLLERYGRVPTLRAGGITAAIGGATISTYFFLPVELQHRYSWVVLAGAGLLQAGCSALIGPATFIYSSELLPNKTRRLGSNIVIAVLNINISLLLKVYPHLESVVGHSGAFLLHVVVSLFQIVFASCCLPETKGMSLEQIQEHFQTSNKRKGWKSPADDSGANDAHLNSVSTPSAHCEPVRA